MMQTKRLTVIEAAEYLKMGRSTVYKLAQEGKLPTHKVGRQWRFDAKELDKWLKSGKLASREERRRWLQVFTQASRILQ
jgi:excisionase family DNA binding protein